MVAVEPLYTRFAVALDCALPRFRNSILKKLVRECRYRQSEKVLDLLRTNERKKKAVSKRENHHAT